MAWVESAEQAYRRLFGKTYIETGPRLVTSNKKKYIALDDLFRHGEKYVEGVEVGKQHTIIEFPDPWRAMAAAMLLQHRELASGRHVIFRGQSSSDYKIVASVYRPNAQIESLDRAKRLLAWFLASNATMLGAVDPNLFYGAAQHYQIWTDLLDVTPDAAVATWFAALAAKGPCPTAAVYVMPKNISPRLQLHVPPPFVERLHRQRGLFIHFPSAEPLSLQGVVELRFPANIDGKLWKFQVIRHRKPVPLLKDNEWIRKVVDWANTLAEDSEIPIPERPPTNLGPDFVLYLRAVKHASVPFEFFNRQQQEIYLAQWADSFNNLIYWLAYLFDDTKPGNEEYLDLQALAHIVASNKALARHYVDLARLTWADRNEHFRYQVEKIEDILAGKFDLKP